MIAVCGPKSLHSLLPINSVPFLEPSVANIIQHATAKNAPRTTQSHRVEPGGRGRPNCAALRKRLRLIQIQPMATAKKQMSAQSKGDRARRKHHATM